MESLYTLQNLKLNKLYPSHGAVIKDAPSKITEYIEHRESREIQIIAALTQTQLSLEELVKAVYGELNPGLLQPATQNARLYITKLLSDRRITEENGLYSLVNPKLNRLRSVL